MLKPYQSIDEKKKSSLFDYHRVTRFQQLLKIVNSSKFQNFCFRGQKNALWKIHSSAQRSWDEWKCKDHCAPKKIRYWEWLCQMPRWMRSHSEILPECVQRHIAKIGDHELLGFMQHFYFPTTLVDFTPDFATALFMAVHSINPQCDKGHFSIYGFNQEVTLNQNEAYGLEEVVKKGREELGHPVGLDDHAFDYKWWMATNGVLIRKDSSSWCPAVSAGRMASQHGLFVHWPSERMSLETLFAATYKMEHNLAADYDEDDPAMKVLDEIYPGYRTSKAVEAERCFERMTCIDIPYSCVKDAQDFCSQMEKTSESLGLSDKRIENPVKELFEQYQKHWLFLLEG